MLFRATKRHFAVTKEVTDNARRIQPLAALDHENSPLQFFYRMSEDNNSSNDYRSSSGSQSSCISPQQIHNGYGSAAIPALSTSSLLSHEHSQPIHSAPRPTQSTPPVIFRHTKYNEVPNIRLPSMHNLCEIQTVSLISIPPGVNKLHLKPAPCDHPHGYILHRLIITDRFTFNDLLREISLVGVSKRRLVFTNAEMDRRYPGNQPIREVIPSAPSTHADIFLGIDDASVQINWDQVK